jgi:ParB/RepB/Spo0J family partition protein
MYGVRPDRAVVAFEANGRHVRFLLPMPDPDAEEFVTTPTGRRRNGVRRGVPRAHRDAERKDGRGDGGPRGSISVRDGEQCPVAARVLREEPMRIKEIPIEQIKSSGNVRLEADEELGDLMDSIEKHGLLQPIVVRHKTLKEYEVVAGHRRLAAMRARKEVTVPCVINDEITPDSRAIVQIVENAQRKQLSAVEYVEAFEQLRRADRSMSRAKIARLIGRSSTWVQHQYDAVKLSGALVSEGVVRAMDAKGMTAGQLIGRAQKHGMTVTGRRSADDISVAAINSTTLNVRCRDAATLARVLEWLDALRDEIRKEASA